MTGTRVLLRSKERASFGLAQVGRTAITRLSEWHAANRTAAWTGTIVERLRAPRGDPAAPVAELQVSALNDAFAQSRKFVAATRERGLV